MEKFKIKFTESEILKNYLTDGFRTKGFIASSDTEEREFGLLKKKTKRVTVMEIICPAEIFREIVSEAIIIFYKFRAFAKAFDGKKSNMLLSAYYGVLLTQEFEKEKETVYKKLPIDSEINIDGIFTFLLAELDYTWQALAALAYKLYAQCKEEEDVFALIRYFLSGEILLNRKLIIDNGLYYDDTNEDIPCVRFFENEEENIALNLLMRKPVEVTVANPRRYSQELIGFITRLG